MSDLTPGESYLYVITPKGLAALHKRLGGVEPLSPVGAVA